MIRGGSFVIWLELVGMVSTRVPARRLSCRTRAKTIWKWCRERMSPGHRLRALISCSTGASSPKSGLSQLSLRQHTLQSPTPT